MPNHDLEILSLISQLENDTYLSEALLFPELSRFEEKPTKARDNLRNSLPDFLDRLPNALYHTRRAPPGVEIREVEIAFSPPKRSIYWSEPVPLTFWAAFWVYEGHHHSYFPYLSLEVIGDSAEELEELIPRNVRAALQRQKLSGRLEQLIWYQRVRKLKLEETKVELHVTAPKKAAEKLTQVDKAPSVLKDVATNLNPIKLARAFEMADETKKLADFLVGRHGRSVLLVGPSGVGKTALFHELVRDRRKHKLASTKFWETTGARLMVGADSFGDWQERCRHVVLEASKDRAILFLGNLFELAEVARHATTPQGMAGFFRPYIERGDLLVVVECTPEQKELLERDHPHLVQAFSPMKLERPEPEKVRKILRAAIKPRRVSDRAIEVTERLHNRFAGYSAYPGRPLRFLRELVAAEKGEIGPPEVAKAFSIETGMPQFMVDDSIALDLKKTQSYFAECVHGQEEAVELVVDLLASVKAALSPPGKPIASLLFIGPTGVGKTEMARTLARYLFNDKRRMVRFDMSEFSDPVSVERLVGGQGGGQGLLTGKVREQPFGVVLFDELEKADPAFFDLLLQILGEGRLTDEHGRTADFTNSLIVMTSNLGATSFSKGPLGFRGPDKLGDHARKEFTSAVKQAFRPELFNRIDRLVPFAPLSRETATSVAQRELGRLQSRDGLAHGQVNITFGSEVAEHLAELGYDRRYGARPLKRAIERAVLERLARLSCENANFETDVLVGVRQDELEWDVRIDKQPKKRDAQTNQEIARRAFGVRRKAQKLADSRQAHTLKNKIHQALRMKQRRVPLDRAEILHALPAREKLAERLKEAVETTRELETSAVLALAGFDELDDDLKLRLSKEWLSLETLILDLYTSNFDRPNNATVLIFPERGGDLKPLVHAYLEVWKALDIEYKAYRLSVGHHEKPEEQKDPILRLPYGDEADDRALWCEQDDIAECARSPIGIAFELEGPRVLPMMLGEAGMHVFGASNPHQLEVSVWTTPLRDFPPPTDLHLIPVKRIGYKRRFYNRARGMVHDPRLERFIPWTGKGLGRILGTLIPDSLLLQAQEASE